MGDRSITDDMTPQEQNAFLVWPEPQPIGDSLPIVEPFNPKLLPNALRAWNEDIAERMQVPIDYAAVVTVLCLAGAVNRRAQIQPKASDHSWIVIPNLWGGIIAAPGLLKSPLIQAVTRPLHNVQELWRQEYQQAEADYERAKEEYEIRHTAWRELFKSSVKKKTAHAAWTENEPPQPKLKRLIVNDATVEALHETLNDNPAGVLVIRDELTGWWSQLDRQGREGERAFFLQAWNGDTSHTIDRIGRGSIHVPACCLSMVGGIQPARLRLYLVDAIIDGPMNDGMIQRFQLLVWPDTPKDWRYVDRLPDYEAEGKAQKVFERLITGDPDFAPRFKFAPDAQQLFIEWLGVLEHKLHEGSLHPALESHLAKYRSLMPSLACLFELADSGNDEQVSLEHAQQAAAWCDYLESHAGRIYSCITSPQLKAAEELAEKIKAGKIGAHDAFSCRDIYHKGWTGLNTPDLAKSAIEVLEDAAWIREVPYESGSVGGRPPKRYVVNPLLRGSK
jgi:Protein of unknown function (DUF3987)